MCCFTAWLVALLILIGSVSSREERSENGTEKRLPRFGFSLLEPLRQSFCRNWCVSPSKMPYIMNLACAAKCPELYLPEQQGATSTSTSSSSTSPSAMSTSSTQRTAASNQGSQAITLGTVTPRTGSPPSASSAQTPTSASSAQTTTSASSAQTTTSASGGQTTPGASGGQTTPGASGVQTTTGASGVQTTTMSMMQG